MSAVNVTNVTVLDNPSMFQNPFQFEISYECLVSLKDDLEWKLIYVGSAEDEKYDQVLESVLIGSVNFGNYRFVFQADPPEPSKIPEEGDDSPFRLAAHPGGEGVLCSFKSDCRLFQVRRADGGEVTIRAAEREIPALQGVGEQRYPKPASCTSS